MKDYLILLVCCCCPGIAIVIAVLGLIASVPSLGTPEPQSWTLDKGF